MAVGVVAESGPLRAVEPPPLAVEAVESSAVEVAQSKAPYALGAELASKPAFPAATGPQSERLTDAAAAAVASKVALPPAIGVSQSERLTDAAVAGALREQTAGRLDAAAVAEVALPAAIGLRVPSGPVLAKECLTLSQLGSVFLVHIVCPSATVRSACSAACGRCANGSNLSSNLAQQPTRLHCLVK